MYGRPDAIVPRNGHTLVVGIVARISGCQNQKELSLEDQEDGSKQVAEELYEGPAEYRVIATRGKGERLDRPELAQIEEMLRTREMDLLVIEDLGRLVRGGDATRLLGVAVDHGTRVISDHDCVDTLESTWEGDALEACADHVNHNAHTSKRLKKKLMNRFRKFGGATAREPAGYIKPEGAKTYDEWRKDDSATPIIQEGLQILRSTLNCETVAEFFNARGFQRGKYCRTKEWKGRDVRRYYQNLILVGRPGRGFRHTVKHHETGRRNSVKNPAGPVFYEVPHLAHVDAVELEEMNSLLDDKNKNCGRKSVNGADPRLRVPRKRTRFPGQHARCWYCGSKLVWGGNGLKNRLMCDGSRERRCWNSIGVNGPLAATRLVELITAELYRLDGFDTQFAEMVIAATANRPGGVSDRWKQLKRDEQTLLREVANVKATILELGPQPLVQAMLDELKKREGELNRERQQLESRENRALNLPSSVAELRQLLEQPFQDLAIDSPLFGDLMRQLVPEFHVFLVRLVNGGHLLPRARVKLSLAGGIPDADRVPELRESLTRVVTIDLFEQPPQRERIRADAVQLAAQNPRWTQQHIANAIEERPTATAVQRALALERRMRSENRDHPYVIVLEPPADYTKLRRHNHPRYRFIREDGYEPPRL